MDRLRSMGTVLRTLTVAAVCWLAACGPALAAADTEGKKGGGATAWTMPYFVVVLGVALGMMLVCRSARRRDRAKPQTYGDAKVITAERKEGGKKAEKKPQENSEQAREASESSESGKRAERAE